MSGSATDTIVLTVNGDPRILKPDDGMRRLLDVLRDDLRLTGTKEGCGEGECGTCSVLLDGTLVNSCLVPVAQASGSSVLTPEGLAATPAGRLLAECFTECHGAQCGFCTPGMIMASYALLMENPRPDEQAVREAISGNICRCTGYDYIIDAVMLAAERGRDIWDAR